MASFKKTYDTDSIVLRRIFAYNPDTNGRISTNGMLVTGNGGSATFQDTISFLSTVGVPTSLASIGQIYNSTFLVAGSNISFSLDGNQVTINGGAGGGGDIAASDLTSTTKGLGNLGYISTPQLTSSLIGLGSMGYLSSKTGLISTPQLTSTTQGLGLLGYLSSFNTISSLNISSGSQYAGFLSSQRIMASSITANKFIGDGSLLVNVPNLGVTYITAGTGIGVNTNTGNVTVTNNGVISITQGSGISITGSDGAYTITATGGTPGTVAAADLVSTTIGINIITISNITSTTKGLGLLGYLSSFNTISSLNISSGSQYTGFLSSQQIMASSITANKFIGDGSLLVNVPGGGGISASDITSTTQGLGLLGYLSSSAELISSPQLTSSLVGLSNLGYILSPDMTSSLVGLSNLGYILLPDIRSSLTGLGTLGYLSSSAELISTPQLTSSLIGLGSMRYISSFDTISSVNISSTSLFTSTTSTTEITAGRVNFGTLYVNNTPIVFDQYGNLQLSFQTL